MSFVASKLFWLLAAPGNVLVLSLGIGTAMLFTRWHRVARGLIGLTAAAVMLLSVVPVGQWLLVPLENRFPPPPALRDVDGIVVLGGGADPSFLAEREQAGLNEGGDRIVALLDLARRFPEATMIYTGGSSSLNHPPVREADGARWILAAMGVDTSRIHFERESRNTVQNALYSKALAKPEPGSLWLLVTSAAHMPRAVGVFRRQGWPVIPYPVDYATGGRPPLIQAPNFTNSLLLLNRAAKEWAGLVGYYCLGYTSALYPGPDA